MLLKEEEKNIITGLLGTIAVHLLVLIIFLIARLDKVRDHHQEPIVIEFDDQMMKDLQQMLEAKKAQESKINPLSQKEARNIAVNTANQIEEKISTEKYIEDLKEELNIDELNQQLDRSLNDPVLEEEIQKPKKETPKKKNYYKGPTRISFDLTGRSDRDIYIPVYKCLNIDRPYLLYG